MWKSIFLLLCLHTLGSNSLDRSGLVLFAVNSFMVNITAMSDVREYFS